MSNILYCFQELSMADPNRVGHDVSIVCTDDQISKIDAKRIRNDGFSWIREDSRKIMGVGELPIEFVESFLLSYAFQREIALNDLPYRNYNNSGQITRVTIYFPPNSLEPIFGMFG